MPLTRLRVLAAQAFSVVDIPGDVAELGCYRGGSTILLANALPDKQVHAFDTLNGLYNLGPEDRLRRSEKDRGHAVGDFALRASAREAVKRRLERKGIRFYQGPFSKTKRAVAGIRFSFVHFDGDTYLSARECLQFFFPRLAPGGKMLIDDYAWPATPGVAKAVDQFAKTHRSLLLQPTRYQIVVQKLSHVRSSK